MRVLRDAALDLVQGADRAQPLGRNGVRHSHALGGFVAGALVGLAAAAGVAIVVGMAATAIAAEVATAGLATPLVAGVAVTVGEFAVNAVVGGKLMGLAEDAGEALGSQSMGDPSGEIGQGSPNVFVNGLPAARVTDAETCDAGKVAQGSASVFINGLPAARVGDKTTCGAVIVGGSGDVVIGGGATSPLPVQSEVPEWARWAAVMVGILPALGGAARAIGPALAEVEATGLARAAQTGVKALGRQMEARAGGLNATPAPIASTAGTDAAAKLRSARTAADIEEARDALKGLSYSNRKQVLDDFARNMDVSTAPNTAVFYSGGRVVQSAIPGKLEYTSARSYAEASSASNGRTTLEQTTGARVLDKVDVYRKGDMLLEGEDADDLWKTASGRYADGASGEVHAYLDNPRSRSIYNTVERPILESHKSAGRVTGIREFDIDKMHDWMTH